MLAVAVAKYLHSLDLVVFDPDGTTGNCFVPTMPSGPDEAVSITPTGGFDQPTKDPDDHPTLQMLVRGPRNTPRPGWDRAKAIYSALTCLDGVWLDEGGENEIWIIGFTAIQSEPVSIGLDDNQRHEWSLNFSARTSNPTLHRPAYLA